MFIAELFILATNGNTSSVHQLINVSAMRDSLRMEWYSGMKRNEHWIHVVTWITTENNTLGENQALRHTWSSIVFVRNFQY